MLRCPFVSIEASCDPDTMFHLLAPTNEGLKARAWESLVGTIAVTLEKRATADDDWELVFEGSSDYAGVEIGE